MAVCSMVYFYVISYFIISDIQCSERITAKNSTVTNSSKKKKIDLLQLINQETLIRFELDKNVHKIKSKVETIKIDNKLASDRLNQEILSINTTLSGLRKNQDKTNEAVNIVKTNQTSTDSEIGLLKEDIKSLKQRQKIDQKLASDQFNQEIQSINTTLSGLMKNQDETNEEVDKVVTSQTSTDSLLKKELKSLKQKLVHLEYNQQKLITDLVKDKTENTLLKKEIESLKASQKELMLNVTDTLKDSEVVAFDATMSGSQTGERGVTVIFSDVNSNIGNGFNKDSSWFSAPVDGVYAFEWTILPQYKRMVATALVVNNVRQQGVNYCHGVQTGGHQSCSMMGIVRLNTGDKVWIAFDGNHPHAANGRHSKFSGFKL